MCVVVPNHNITTFSDVSGKAERFIYHRLDLQPNKMPLCRIGKKLGTRQSPVMKFTTAAFVNPFLYVRRTETAETVEIYEQFVLKAPTSNANLKHIVITVVSLTEHLDDFWKLNDYPYWRYVATREGVFKIYPGTVLPKNYDPIIRRWFLSAEANNGDLVLTPPYVDAFGSGVVLTLCKTVVVQNGSV
ncbi:hypothetical protein NP493_519g04007 [Ridgeia piscesae]|uniref:Uncharacterized protein n=1 Tax=Ridgeia piscesae TaxID=27915 RepID=A0AAD9KX86_RIDPI|nr:hypothetical protein NP493_519g04007 [Ridgeia piscesae]